MPCLKCVRMEDVSAFTQTPQARQRKQMYRLHRRANVRYKTNLLRENIVVLWILTNKTLRLHHRRWTKNSRFSRFYDCADDMLTGIIKPYSSRARGICWYVYLRFEHAPITDQSFRMSRGLSSLSPADVCARRKHGTVSSNRCDRSRESL